VPLERDGELVFESATREVAIEGDAGFVREVLSRCNGRRSVAEIRAELDDDPAVAELVEALVDAGVLTASSQAWKNFHRQSSVTSGLYRNIEDAELYALMRERFEAEHRDEFHPLRPRDTQLAAIAAGRVSARPSGGERPPEFAELSALVAAMYGSPEGTHRPIPSAGAIYPLAIHVLVRRTVGPLAPGLWWYDPQGGGLWLVRDDELDIDGMFLPHPVTDPLRELGHPIVFVSADLERISRKYSNRGYRFALMEAGAAIQNAYLLGAELDLPVRVIGGIVEEAVDSFLELPPDTHSLLALLIGN
jgi:SagB-type dehydrogenase family enzyme